MKGHKTMPEFKIGNAKVRVHGTPNQDRVKAATEKFMKKVERIRKNEAKNTGRQMVHNR